MKEGWEYKKLGEIGNSELGKTKDIKRNKGKFHPYLCAINVLWDRFDLSDLKEMKFEDEEKERYSIQKGDLIICEGGDIGRAAIWNYDYPIFYQNALHRLRFKDDIDARFILHYLFYLKINGILDERYGKGVTIKHLVKSSLLNIPVPVPPLEEQKRIVEELDLLSDIIEKQKQQLKELDILAKSIFYDMFGDPITNEKGWVIIEFEKCIERIKYPKKLNTKDYLYSGKYPIVSQEENLISGYTDQEDCVYRASRPIVVFGDHTRCYKYISFDFALGADGVKILLPNIQFNTRFFYYCLLLSHIPSLGYSRHYKLLKELLIILPPLDLQNLFASKIEAIEKQKEDINKSIEETLKLFDYTMDKYFG